MKFPYIPATVKIPVPSLGGGLVRPRLFNTDFHGDDCEVFVTPNRKFPGNVAPPTP